MTNRDYEGPRWASPMPRDAARRRHADTKETYGALANTKAVHPCFQVHRNKPSK